ncbi:uncharacterized protein LOC124273369 [Haliotis rubra]|uniref:uncharacterized protein LOC124273369 n=1 Tax=Haliotis rubra TaxID=36100 RepID=UPI001EE5BB13|nr:uncharacterized protein LOC124273369 [Haliotis rubra]
MLNGSCVCKKGRVRNENGRCVWPGSDTMSHAAAPTTSAHLRQDTQSQVTQSPIQTSNRSTGANEASSTPPTTAPTTGTSNLAEYVWVIIVVVVLVVVALIIAVLYKVVKWRRRRHVREIPVHGESHRLTSEEDSTGTSSTETSEKEEKPPSQVIINNYNFHNFVGNKSVQYGDRNQMAPQGAAEDEEVQ